MSDAANAPDLSRLRIEREPVAPPRRNKLVRVLVVLLLLLLLGAGALWATGRLGGPPQVETARVVRTGGAAAVSGTAANGYVVARRQAALSTDIQGRVVELRVEEGDHVKAGDVIARLDTSEQEATRDRIKADLLTARAQAEWASIDYERKAPLITAGAVSQADVDQARVERDRTAAHVASLEAGLAEIEVQINKSSVYAPFDGVITAKNAEEGEVVSSISAGANSRGSVATLVDFETLEVQIELAQTSLKAAREGAPVLIYLDAFPDKGYRGRVRQIWPTADRQKATVELRAEFLERDEHILPEMGVRVVFTGDEQAAAAEPEVLVPERAVLRAGDVAAVFVLDGEHVARRDIQVDPPQRGNARVTAGLEGGETVVLDPPASLRDGQAVRLAEKKP
ncbi:MAG TPA: efflux RND transporter periplasmic adaptor subunit [Planctomycetota bacterium]|nr:efflux RND transporter periplasmic adaptor subunit [Planctomycetota bacterium]